MKNGKKQKARPKGVNLKVTLDDDDDVYYYIGERLKLEEETERWALVRGSGRA